MRHGATSATVLRLYHDQYKVEHTYRLMKSGMGVDSVFVRTPKRADALLFVVAVATLISSVIDALLRRSACPYRTARRAAEAIQHAAFAFDRTKGEITVVGPEGSDDRVFAYIEGIGLDPSALFGKRRASVGTRMSQQTLSPTNRLQKGRSHDLSFFSAFLIHSVALSGFRSMPLPSR